VYNLRERRAEKHFMSLMGTERNCAGGPTPRGTWISCEESIVLRDGEHFAEDHGWCFEVVPTMAPAPTPPRPIKAMGRFNHEACCTDPRTGIVYMTEDQHDGLIFRYVPNERENLLAGGSLQALKVLGRPSLDTRNWPDETTGTPPKEPIRVGTRLACVWVPLEDVESPKEDLRHRGFAAGAARFARGEGMWWGQQAGSAAGSAYFCGTNGGPKMLGQVWRLTPSHTDEPDMLELFVESTDAESLQHADNIAFAPWGDLVICEDGDEPQRLVRVRPDGSCERIGRNRLNGSELAGATFSPDGSTLFVNIQNPGLTLAITGPWRGQG
jgi:secreted PhoX family phosphatase